MYKIGSSYRFLKNHEKSLTYSHCAVIPYLENEALKYVFNIIYCFVGDVNLPRDKFLRQQVTLDDGWVPLDVLTRFNRLAKLSTDTDVIAKAINKSLSGLLEVLFFICSLSFFFLLNI